MFAPMKIMSVASPVSSEARAHGSRIQGRGGATRGLVPRVLQKE
jgi:hypothetical protein